MHSISLLALQEPFVSHTAASVICAKLGFMEFVFSENNKIWILWRNNISFRVLSQSTQFSHSTVRHSSFFGEVFITGIYAQSSRFGRRSLWTDLLHRQQSCVARP